MESLEKICVYLGCNIGEIVDFSSTNSSSKTNSKDFTSIELFAGAGGLALGIEKAEQQKLDDELSMFIAVYMLGFSNYAGFVE